MYIIYIIKSLIPNIGNIPIKEILCGSMSSTGGVGSAVCVTLLGGGVGASDGGGLVLYPVSPLPLW